MGRGAGVSRTNRPGRFSPVASRVALGLGCIAVLIFPVSWERLPDFRPVRGRTVDSAKPYPGIDPTADPRTDGRIVPTTSTSTTTTTVPGQPPAPPTTTTTTTPSPGVYAYMELFAGKPPYVSTCKPVQFVIRKTGGPPNGDQLVLQAVQRISDVTGVKFEWKGFTDAMWGFNVRRTRFPWENDRESLWIGWASESEVPDFRATSEFGGTVLGVGGPIVTERSDGQREIIGGGVALRSGADVPATFGPGETLGNVILHELGHAFGLDHVNSIKELLNPSLTPQTPDGFGPGDVQGLQGITKGC